MMNLPRTSIAALLALSTLSLSAVGHADELTAPIDDSESCQSPFPPEIFPIPAGAEPFGKSLSEWSASWWQWALAIPKSINPTREGDCGLGQTDPNVFYLAGNFGGASVRNCTIPADKKVFFPLVNAITRQVPEAPSTCSWLVTPEQLIEYVKGAHDGAEVVLFAELDGAPIADLYDHRADSAFTFTAPELATDWLLSRLGPILDGNACNIPAGPRLGATDGFWIMLYSLDPGAHVLHFGGTVTYPSGYSFNVDVTYNLIQE